MLELQRDPTADNPDGVYGVHERIDRRFQQTASR
jgi:hypothetical protein